jgi:C2H2 type zinc finger protein
VTETTTTTYICHHCGRSFSTPSKLRVHAVVDEHRAATPEERRGSRQRALPLGSRREVGR